MSQDTRKDPRAKVLTMTVRYKSATLDEFIEHHSYDISRGGMFIKTPSPFPPGTLLKFEVKIAEDRKVMQGVGRVVWKRESPESTEDRPPGMGVKFIKIDGDSKALIDKLVAQRGTVASAYEEGQVEASLSASPSTQPPASSQPPAGPAKEKGPHKPTMIGLGAMGSSADEAGVQDDEDEGSGTFFPQTDSLADMPKPEDRTVMKQAAELLQDALREAGGSLDEVADAKKPEDKVPPAKATSAVAAPPRARAAGPQKDPAAEGREAGGEAHPAVASPGSSARPAAKTAARAMASSKQPTSVKPSSKPVSYRSPPRKPLSERPPAKVSVAREGGKAPEIGEGGGSRTLILVGVLAAIVTVIFFATRRPAEPPLPTAPAPEPPKMEEPRAHDPVEQPSRERVREKAAEPAIPASSGEPGSPPSAEPENARETEATKQEPAGPPPEAAPRPSPRPRPVAPRPRPRPQPEPAASATPPSTVAPDAGTAPGPRPSATPAPAPPAPVTPAAPPPAATPTAPPAPAPAPAPDPNPY